jgi:hypothetical protein
MVSMIQQLQYWCTLDNILRFPTQKYVVIKDKVLVRGVVYLCSVEQDVATRIREAMCMGLPNLA